MVREPRHVVVTDQPIDVEVEGPPPRGRAFTESRWMNEAILDSITTYSPQSGRTYGRFFTCWGHRELEWAHSLGVTSDETGGTR